METQISHEFHSCPLYRQSPGLFDSLVSDYSAVIRLAVRESVSISERPGFVLLRNLARRAGESDASPQDLIAVHLSALSNIIRSSPRNLARACIRQSRLLLVKMIGELALFYRDRAVNSR